VGHSECSRGWAPLVSRSTGSSDCRCAAVKNAAAAPAAPFGAEALLFFWLAPPLPEKKPFGGAAAPGGSSWHAARRSSGITGHRRSANSKACEQHGAKQSDAFLEEVSVTRKDSI